MYTGFAGFPSQGGKATFRGGTAPLKIYRYNIDQKFLKEMLLVLEDIHVYVTSAQCDANLVLTHTHTHTHT